MGGRVPARDGGLLEHAQRGPVVDHIPVFVARVGEPRDALHAQARRTLEAARRPVCERAVEALERLLVDVPLDAVGGLMPGDVGEDGAASFEFRMRV
jgi:hypothetical protein